MNYISEINAFYDWLIRNPISANAQALWHRLMAYCNTFSWAENFTITNGRLVEDLNISRIELDRVRNILSQKGLIEYEKGNGNQCGTYKIISFVYQNNANPVTQTDTQLLHKPYTVATQTDTQTVPLNKLNKTKQEDKKDDFIISKSHAGIIDAWNALNLQELKIIQGTREELLNARIKQYGEPAIYEAIENIKKSGFLQGQNNTGFVITFDWLVKPNNFPKVLEGNYINKPKKSEDNGNTPNSDNNQISDRMSKIKF